MNAAPVEVHQVIAGNILTAPVLTSSPNCLPQPDVFVKAGPATDQPVTADALVLFEVLSKSNTKTDQAWQRRVYASIPNCQHYVTVAQNTPAVTRYDRATGWKGADLKGLKDKLALPALGPRSYIDLSEIYRWTPLAPTRS